MAKRAWRLYLKRRTLRVGAEWPRLDTWAVAILGTAFVFVLALLCWRLATVHQHANWSWVRFLSSWPA